ncbi:hypothetical protein ACFLTE_08730 [Bacteroidota bacterium]
MKRKKKKKSSQYAKQKLAEAKKAYLKNTRNYLQLYNCSQAFDLIPAKGLEYLYNNRVRNPKIITGKDCNAGTKQVKRLHEAIIEYLKTKKVDIMPDKQASATIIQHLTVGLNLFCFFNTIPEEDLPYLDQLKQLLDENFTYEETYHEVQTILSRILSIFASFESDFNNKLFYMNTRYTEQIPVNFEIEINDHKNTPNKVEIEGIKRDIYPVGWGKVNMGIDWLTIGTEFNLAKEPLKVYIQSHAIDRLVERIDSINPGAAQLFLYISLLEPVIIHHNNTILIEYRVDVNKAGYMVMNIINSMAVIRTFLFLTNNGTPEGQKLEQLSGLKKIDKQYLAIDKLSTFQVSDLADNKELRELFEEAGCGSLFKIDYKSTDFEDISLNLAAKFEKYIYQ